MAEQADIKPADTITIAVKDQNSDSLMHFKIKTTTKFEKVIKAYAERKGVDVSAVRFLLDGDRVKEQATPKELEMTESDVIDAVLHQVGGGRDNSM